jgi:phage terminase large subunit-like protein
MKQDYPHYGRFGLEEIFNKFPQLERDTIEQFISYCAITAGKRKQQDIKRSIIQFRDIVEKPFTDISLQDMRCFCSVENIIVHSASPNGGGCRRAP